MIDLPPVLCHTGYGCAEFAKREFDLRSFSHGYAFGPERGLIDDSDCLLYNLDATRCIMFLVCIAKVLGEGECEENRLTSQ